MSDTFMVKAYSGLTHVLAPLLPFYLNRRATKGKEDKARIKERFGHAGQPRPNGHLVWLHGASVGETMMLLPLIDKILERPDTHVLLTSGTVTSAELMAKRLPDRAIHQYVPVDTPGAVKRFLAHWQPDAAIWAESEIWPNLIRGAKKSGIPLALINARMSDSSIMRWKKHGVKNAKSVFGNFEFILAGNESTAKGLSGLLGRDIPMLGNLKNAAPPLPVNETELTRLQMQIGKRTVWCAASTHAGEDEMMLTAHKALLHTHKDALLILIPRHPERGDDIAKLIDRPFARRASGHDVNDNTQVYLMDTIGELGLAYRFSGVTVMGGAFMDTLAGHNPLEPARLGNAVLSGPYVASFQDTYDAMIDSGAALCVAADALTQALTVLISTPSALAKTQKLAKAFADNQDSVLDAVWERLEPLMPPKNLRADA